MKAIQYIMVTVFLVMSGSVSANILAFSIDGLDYQVNAEESTTVTLISGKAVGSGGYGHPTSLTLPDTVVYNGDEYAVTAIGPSAFAYKECYVKKLTLPQTVKTIGKSAFALLKNPPESIVLPENLAMIDTAAFQGMNTLTQLRFPPSLKEVKHYAFCECYQLNTVIIDDIAAWCGVKFENEKSTPFPDLHFERGLATSHLILNGEEVTSLIIPEGVTEIGQYAFFNCKGIKSVSVPNSLKRVGLNAFKNCQSLERVDITDLYSWCNVHFESNPLSCAEHLYLNGEEVIECVIPDEVKKIGYACFMGCKSITSITFHNGLEEVEKYAFKDCSNLATVNVPSLENWCNITFNDVTSTPNLYATNFLIKGDQLTNLSFPSGITQIKPYVFSYINGLKSAIMGDNVDAIGDCAFLNCTSLSSVSIPKSVTRIGSKAFKDCSLLSIIELSDLISDIGVEAFDGTAWYGAQPDGLVYVGSSAYHYKGTATDVALDIKVGTLSIAPNCFYKCSGLTNVSFPGTLTTIGDYAFYGCSGLTTINIPSSVNEVGKFAFSSCSGLTNAIIESQLIGENMFASCSSLTDVTMGDYVAVIRENAFYRCTKLANINTSNLLKTIDRGAFQYCTNLASIIIPHSVTKIGAEAFNQCTALSCLSLGKSITDIGDRAFYNCNSLKELIWEPVNCESMGDMPKMNINSVTIGNSVQMLPSSFLSGSKIIKIIIPMSVVEIGDNAFRNCEKLKTLMLTDSLKTIGNYAFYNCSSLTGINIPNSVTHLEEGAFCQCRRLESVTVGNSVTSIKPLTFSYCDSLKTLLLSNSITTIGDDAFRACYRLADLALPNSLTQIGDNSFSDCNGLTSVVLPDAVTSIGNNAFRFCNNMKSITIPASISSIGNGAFSFCIELENISSYPNPNKVTLGNDVFINVPKTTCTLHVLEMNLDAYMSAYQWKSFYNIIGDLHRNCDVSGDGVFDIKDITSLINNILTGSLKEIFDINGDGEVDVKDVTFAINEALN